MHKKASILSVKGKQKSCDPFECRQLLVGIDLLLLPMLHAVIYIYGWEGQTVKYDCASFHVYFCLITFPDENWIVIEWKRERDGWRGVHYLRVFTIKMLNGQFIQYYPSSGCPVLQGIFLQQQNVNNETTNTISIWFSIRILQPRYRTPISFVHLFDLYLPKYSTTFDQIAHFKWWQQSIEK